MSRWFRMYDEALDDPKVQSLGADDFRGWINLLCLASRNDGKLPAIPAIAFALRLSPDGAQTLVERLLDGGLLDSLSGGVNGCHYAPHGWKKRQYKSDGSTERVKRFRKRSNSVSETGPETETETEIIPLAKANGDPAKVFWENATAYLGANKRGMIGKWIKQDGMEATAAHISAAQAQGIFDPIPWIEKRRGAGVNREEICADGVQPRAGQLYRAGNRIMRHSGIPI